MRTRWLLAVVAGSLVALWTGGLSAQALGDVAKKEEERRKQVDGQSKVYTNKDLGPVPPSSSPPPASSGAASDAGKPADKAGDKTGDASKGAADKDAKDAKDKDKEKEKDKDAGGKKDQAYWSGRMKAATAAIERDTTLAEAMQSRINALTTDFVNRDDPAQRSIIERERQKAVAELDRLKKQIVDDRKAVTDLEEEARRAGVPPGWLR